MVPRLTQPVPQDQAFHLRRLAQLRGHGLVSLAVTSGKGGVGKSNLAVNLSICLAARGLRVTLVDVDLGLANADLLMDIHPRYTLSHVLSGLRTIEGVCVDGPAGIRFVPGASGVGDVANLSDFERRSLLVQVQKLHANTDIVVLDCGAGLARNATAFALQAGEVLVVTTPEPTAMTDAYATIKTLHGQGYPGRVSVVVNMAESRAAAGAVFTRLSQVARRFLNYSIADGGYVLHDTAVLRAVRERCPFVLGQPDSNASACIAAIAGALAGRYGEPQRRGGWLDRVVGLFG